MRPFRTFREASLAAVVRFQIRWSQKVGCFNCSECLTSGPALVTAAEAR